MKNIIGILALCLLFGLAQTGYASQDEKPRPIAFTYYRQMGWGDRVQVGYVDEKGGLWFLKGNDSSLHWPYGKEEQLAWLTESDAFTPAGTLEHEDLFSLKSLVSGTEDQGSRSFPAANDAGTERSYAVRYNRDGTPEIILLGMSGDDCFENFDPDAQALYLYLHLQFPEVTCYAGLDGMGPAGFTPVPLMSFMGVEDADLSGAAVKAFYQDCEAGSREISMDLKAQARIWDLLLNGQVVGKANATLTTGGMTDYCFYDRNGRFLFTMELYSGLLVCSDGMYYISDTMTRNK